MQVKQFPLNYHPPPIANKNLLGQLAQEFYRWDTLLVAQSMVSKLWRKLNWNWLQQEKITIGLALFILLQYNTI